MMIYALRWPIDRAHGDDVSDGLFGTLANLVSEALDHEAPLSLPTSDHPIVAAALSYTKETLASVTADEVSRAVAVSERTLRRLFRDTVGLSWRSYLLYARMLRAMALLAGPGQSVQETSTAVGFDSLASFTRAFTQPAATHRPATAKGLPADRIDYRSGESWSPRRSNPSRSRLLTAFCQRSSCIGVFNGSGKWQSIWLRRIWAPSASTSELSAAHVRSRPGRVSPNSARWLHRAVPTATSASKIVVPRGLPSTRARPT